MVKVSVAADYLTARGHADAVSYLKSLKAPKRPANTAASRRRPSGQDSRDLRHAVVEQLAEWTSEQRERAVRVFDNDLEDRAASRRQESFPQVYVQGGVMERGTIGRCRFGMERGRQGVFATFSAFQEMLISEITMARLNDASARALLARRRRRHG